MRNIIYITICLLTGCLARPHLDRQSFIFSPTPAAAPQAAPGHRILGLRTLQVAEPFDGRSFVYRTDEFSYDRDPYAEFMVHPADALAEPVSTWFRDAGGFNAVVEAGSALKPNTLVEIQVLQLYGDFRPSEHPNAVLAMRFVFFDAPNGHPGQVLLERVYSRKIPLKEKTPTALIEGWNQSLAEILGAVMADFGRSDTNAPAR